MGFTRGQNAGQWNDDRVNELKQLWAKGLSAGVIALRMQGFSRNAIIGKVHRLGLPGRATPIGKARLGGRKSVALQRARRKTKPQESIRFGKVKSYEPVAVAPLPPEPPKPSKLFKLVDLEDNQCRFPFGDPKSKDFGFCGCVKSPGSSYCPGHAHLCLTTPDRSKAKPVTWNFNDKRPAARVPGRVQEGVHCS